MNKQTLVIAVAVAIATMGVAQAGPMTNGPAPGHPASSSAQLSPAQRGALVAQIVRTWGPFVQKVHNTSVSAWAGRMKATFAVATDSNLQRAAGMKTFQGMMDALVGQHLTDAQVRDSLATQALVQKSGPVRALLGSTAGDLVYTPLPAPCRIVDTRMAVGHITGGTTTSFLGSNPGGNFAFQGGNGASDCGIPASPSALMLNFTVVNDLAPGWLTVFPYGAARPLAANLNYATGAIEGNEIAAKMTIGGAADFSVYAQSTTDVVVDAVGYFMAPQVTPLDVTTTQFNDIIPAGTSTSFNHSCPAGYTNAGGGCWDYTGTMSIYGNVAQSDTQYCGFRNPTAGDISGYTFLNCARIPGR